MKPADKNAPSQTKSLSFDFDLDHPPRKVWRALTDPDLLEQWLLPVIGLELEPGAEFTLMAPPQPGWDGVVSCRMLEVEPQEKISWQWVVGDIDTVVTFTLTPTDAGTLLKVVHEGFRADQKREFGGARYGWRMMGEKLVDLLSRLP